MRSYIVALSAMLLLLSGCEKYPEPEAKTYKIEIVVTESAAETKRLCGNDSFVACAYDKLDPCMIVTTKSDWEKYAVHEIAHCMNINHHK